MAEAPKSIATINGLEIKTNSLYIVHPKPDASAPSGFRDLGTTMLQTEGGGKNIACKWVEIGGGKGLWDTGFYEDSPCYAGLDSQQKTSIVNAINTHIVEPYEKFRNKKLELHQDNDEFWDKYSVHINERVVFNTEYVEQLLALYMCMRTFSLTPMGQEGNFDFSNSAYIIKDKNQSEGVKQQRTRERYESIDLFLEMTKSSKTDLIAVMKDLEIIRVTDQPSTETLRAAFDTWLNKDYQNPPMFVTLAGGVLKNEEEKEACHMRVKLRKCIKTGRFQKEGSNYAYKGVTLGRSIPEIHANITKEEMVELYDEVRLMQ